MKGLCSVRLMVGLDDLKGLFQPKQFCDSKNSMGGHGNTHSKLRPLGSFLNMGAACTELFQVAQSIGIGKSDRGPVPFYSSRRVPRVVVAIAPGMLPA